MPTRKSVAVRLALPADMPGAQALPTRRSVALKLALPADMPGAQALLTLRSVTLKLALPADMPGAQALLTLRSVSVRLALPADMTGAQALPTRGPGLAVPLAGEVSLFVTPLMSPSGLHAAATGALAPAWPSDSLRCGWVG